MLTPSKIYAVKTGHPHDFSACRTCFGDGRKYKVTIFWGILTRLSAGRCRGRL